MDIREEIENLVSLEPYSMSPEEKSSILLGLLKEELEKTWRRHPGLWNYVQSWPVDYRSARDIAELPYLPVAVFKAEPPLSLVEPHQIKTVLTSSATTGQTPSKVVLDRVTARRMSKSVLAIAQNFIGLERRPYLIVDVPAAVKGGARLGARGAAIQGLLPFAKEVVHCLGVDEKGRFALEVDKLLHFSKVHRTSPVLVYGFTHMLWTYLVEPLMAKGINLRMPNVHILHSGGWKRLQNKAVDKDTFNNALAEVFGCSVDRVIDFYGMVENVGVIYPDCSFGNKHAPAFAEVIVRNPLTLDPVSAGDFGIVQVCSVLPESFPGQLILTDDIAEVIYNDGCPCGRRGISFRFVRRVPEVEMRGCANIDSKRAETLAHF